MGRVFFLCSISHIALNRRVFHKYKRVGDKFEKYFKTQGRLEGLSVTLSHSITIIYNIK